MEIKLQVGVKVLLKNKEGNYLIVKRSDKKYDFVKQKWDIVGGRINVEDTLFDALKREVFEETQLSILTEPELLGAQDIFFKEFHVVRLTYIAGTEGEPVLDTDENVEYKWLSAEEIRNQEGIDEYLFQIVEKNLERLK